MMNTSSNDSSGLSPSPEFSNITDQNYDNTTEADFTVSLNLPYVVCEVLVAVTAVIGNALTIVVFVNDRKLRRLTNYYIVSLALADLLVGMPGIPFAILTSVGIPRNSYMCPPMLSLLLILCTVSIFCLVAVSVDRYWAILYPLRYSRVMTAKIARRIILLCWLAGIFLGMLPMMGWRNEPGEDKACYFVLIMDYNYLVFIYFSTIVFPGILMAFFYGHIYTVVLKQTKLSVKSEHGTLRQIAAQEPQSEAGSVCTQHGGSQRQRPHFIGRNQSRSHSEVNRCDSRRCSTSTNIVHQVTHANKREVKAAKSLSIIVLFFLICWFPLYTINCVQAFCRSCKVPAELMFFTIILTHVNSAVNPFLYAYHMKDFRLALKRFILERILRRKLQSDLVSHRSVVSAHHSTLYRVAVGGGSPQLANVNTPHTNTPIPGSTSPVAGTPSGIRSRSSTLGSYGHWFQAKGVSSSVSLEKTPEDTNELPTRPRAATIISHTSPASAHSTGEGACLKKPLLSTSNLLTSTDDSEHQTVSLPSDAVIVNFGATDPTEVVISIDQNSDGISTVTDDSVNQQVGATPSFQLNDYKLPPVNSAPIPDASENPVTLTSESSLNFTNKNDSSLTDSVELSSASGGGETSVYLKNVTCHYEGLYDVGKNTQSLNCESQNPLGLAKYLSDHDMCDSELSNTDDDKKISEPKLIKNCLIYENKPNGTDNSLKASSGKRLAASEANMSQIPNGTDDITSSSSSKYESINNCDVLTKRKESEIVSLEATPNQSRTQEGTDESSPLTQEFYKYLPKMLRKKDENKKSRSTRTGKGWFSNMMRNRSYHGLSVEVVGSKQLPRAKSISGAMDT